jgi:3-methyladenine DNA glycosylase/8-oxoguanine DNA glycosylase
MKVYPSKKAKRKAEYIKREAQRLYHKDREIKLQKAMNNGTMEEIAKLMGVKLF